jgi:hypothetical protein
MRLAAGAFALLSFLGAGNESVNFDAIKPGVAPPNWTFVSALGSPSPRWEVRYDPSAPSRGNVLEKVGNSAPESESPVAVFDKVICRDGDLSVKFKIDKGGRGRGAGVVWRYQDASNYYLLRFSADEKNIALFRVRNGKPEALLLSPEGGRSSTPAKTLLSHDIQLGQWYAAKVVFRNEKIRVLLGNRKLFDAVDSTMESAGKAGVWTRGRTTASFDDFKIEKKS